VLSSQAEPLSKGTPGPQLSAATEDLSQRLLQISRGDGTKLFTSVMTKGRTLVDDGDALFTSRDGKHALIRARTSVPVFEAASEFPRWREPLEKAVKNHPGISLNYLSFGSADSEIFELIHRDLDNSLIFTLPLTLLVLMWAFGSLRAALIPLAVALISLAASLGGAALLSHPFGPISATANQLVVLLVLAIGVDYSLFLVSRVREDLARGYSFEESVIIARKTAGLSVLWSGVTVAVSLAGLFLMKDTVLSSMALVSVVAVGITVIGTLLALPSLLLLFPRVILRSSCKGPQSSRAEKWISLSTKYPVRMLFLAAVPLILISLYATKISLGSVMDRHLLPQRMQSAHAFGLIKEHFPKFSGTELSLVLSSPKLDVLEDEGELQPFFSAFLESDIAFGPYEIDWSNDRTVARYRFGLEGTSNEPASRALLHRIREKLIPEYLAPLGVSAEASGEVAYVVDEMERYLDRTPQVLGAVLIFSMVFLLIAFRSLVVPAKAMALNLLSTMTSFGTLVFVFQGSLFPPLSYGVIEGFVPALLFAVLFGLSMDYHVLLLSRIQEEVQKGAPTHEAILTGILACYRTITSAALIMACVFLTIACLELPVMKQLGLGLAVAVIIDATIVRTMLLPASMVLLGRLNWYLPRWLEWLPRVKLD
jgi:RND superfamily putative drug exporter